QLDVGDVLKWLPFKRTLGELHMPLSNWACVVHRRNAGDVGLPNATATGQAGQPSRGDKLLREGHKVFREGPTGARQRRCEDALPGAARTALFVHESTDSSKAHVNLIGK